MCPRVFRVHPRPVLCLVVLLSCDLRPKPNLLICQSVRDEMRSLRTKALAVNGESQKCTQNAPKAEAGLQPQLAAPDGGQQEGAAVRRAAHRGGV